MKKKWHAIIHSTYISIHNLIYGTKFCLFISLDYLFKHLHFSKKQVNNYLTNSLGVKNHVFISSINYLQVGISCPVPAVPALRVVWSGHVSPSLLPHRAHGCRVGMSSLYSEFCSVPAVSAVRAVWGGHVPPSLLPRRVHGCRVGLSSFCYEFCFFHD
jgi:hypothetical protein